MTSAANSRQPEFPIDPLFIDRWSPRAFTGEAIPDDILFSLFEAAHWAPSGYNAQPWRFSYSKRGSASWEGFLGTLVEFNRGWAQQASALIILSAAQTVEVGGKIVPSTSYALDTGAAWASLALQATRLGWSAHGIGGFDKDAAAKLLNIPDQYEVQLAIAIGRRGDKATLPDALQAREAPTPRRSVRELVAEGQFPS